jgi:DNA recombination protein RmuC
MCPHSPAKDIPRESIPEPPASRYPPNVESILPIISTVFALAAFFTAALALGAYLLGRRHGQKSVPASPSDALVTELRQRLATVEARLAAEAAAKEQSLQNAAAAESARKAIEEQIRSERETHSAALTDLRERHTRELVALRESFAHMGTEVLRGMTPDVTKEVAAKVEPLLAQVQQALTTYQSSLQTNLTSQQSALAQVRSQMEEMSRTTAALASSTNDFTAVLKSSQHRGRWGEQTLRRVVEAAGLSPHCDFQEQAAHDDLRPDLLIRLPAKRCIIIDSKVPELDAALAGNNTPNRAELIREHAEKLRRTIKALSEKNYPAALTRDGVTAFEKVILFLPAESLLSTALEGNNDLVLDAAKEGVLLATPATLIGFLAAINLSWQQHQQAENAQAIAHAAIELFNRVAKFTEHLGKLRKALQDTNSHFNSLTSSFNARVRPQGERLKTLGGTDPQKDLPEIPPIESSVDPTNASA